MIIGGTIFGGTPVIESEWLDFDRAIYDTLKGVMFVGEAAHFAWRIDQANLDQDLRDQVTQMSVRMRERLGLAPTAK